MRRSWIGLVIGTVIITTGAHGQQLEADDRLEALIQQEDSRPYFLVDVRTLTEFQSGHIPTATNTPHNRIGIQPPTGDKDALIILYCATGIRSNHARRTLERAGYQNVIDFGGIGNWRGEVVFEAE